MILSEINRHDVSFDISIYKRIFACISNYATHPNFILRMKNYIFNKINTMRKRKNIPFKHSIQTLFDRGHDFIRACRESAQLFIDKNPKAQDLIEKDTFLLNSLRDLCLGLSFLEKIDPFNIESNYSRSLVGR